MDAMLSRKQPLDWDIWLPKYASPLAPLVSREDCRTLHKEKAFEVPCVEIRDQLLRNYIQYVYPVLPILNLGELLVVIHPGYTGTKRVSLLLFQALMFSATVFQTRASIEIEGFRSRREARKTRFERAKLLYSLGSEDDRLTILQAVLLLTHWDDSCEDDRDAFYFVGISKALLTAIETEPKTSETRLIKGDPGLWNRICWSCYIQDRIVAIISQRPIHIQDEEFCLPMLQLSDFGAGPFLTRCCVGSDGSRPTVKDPSAWRLLSQTTIALAECCQCISRILRCQYTVAVVDNGGSVNKQSQYLIPRHPGAAGEEVLLRDRELEEWYSSLPEGLQWRSSGPLHHIEKHGDVVLFFRSFLCGIYGLASSILHRPQATFPLSSFPELAELSRRRVRDSALHITQIYSHPRFHGTNGLLPPGQVAMLKSAIVVHLKGLNSTNSSTRQSSLVHFQLCTNVLQQLRDTYASADTVLALADPTVPEDTTPKDGQGRELMDRVNRNAQGHFDLLRWGSANVGSSDIHVKPRVLREIDKLGPCQLSELLCSHFMMTPSEKAMLECLVTPPLSEFVESFPDTTTSSSSCSSSYAPSVKGAEGHHQAKACETEINQSPANDTEEFLDSGPMESYVPSKYDLIDASLLSLSYSPKNVAIPDPGIWREQDDWSYF